MNKNLKIFLIVFASIIAFLYIVFLVFPPIFNATFDFEKYKTDIQKIVKDSSKLNLDYSSIKIYTTPFLSAGVIVDDVNVYFDDNSTLLKSSKIKAGIALPSLLTLTVKTAKCDIVNPFINLEIVNDEQYKIVRIVENIINENNAKPKLELTKQQKFINGIVEKIRIKVPFVKITNFNVLINDLKSNHNLKLNGDKLIVGYNGARNSFKVKTNAKLLSDEKENISANLNIKVSLPKVKAEKEQVDPDERIAIPFLNPVTVYQTYDLNAIINSKLRVKNVKDSFVCYGHFNIDDFNLKLSDIRLPNSFIHSKMRGKTIKLDSNLYSKDNEKIALLANLKYGKNPKIETQILTDKIHFSNLMDLLVGLLDSLNVKNNLKEIKSAGYLVADASVWTNFKKLKSKGSILIKDGSFINQRTSIGINDIIANIILDNNTLNIKDTSLSINGSDLNVDGYIDTKSNANIKINVDNLSLPELYNAFASNELKNIIKINSAFLTSNIDVKGKLAKLDATLVLKLNDLILSDAKDTFIIKNDALNVNFALNPKTINGLISNNGLSVSLPAMNTIAKINDLKVDFNNDSIMVNPFNILYNDFSMIGVKGEVLSYLKEPELEVLVDGKISTQDINKTLGRDVVHFIASKGTLPIKVSMKGDSKELGFIAQIFADKDNYLTPISLDSLIGSKTLTQLDFKMKGHKLRIKDSGVFKLKNAIDNSEEPPILDAEQIIELTTIIENNHINLFRINLPKKERGHIALFENSLFDAQGKIVLTGKLDDLNFGGDFKLSDLNIPEILFSTDLIDLDFIFNGFNLKAQDVNINGSIINADLKADLTSSNLVKISDIDVKSDLINVDNILVSVDKLMKYIPVASSTSTKSTQPADIPLVVDGNFDIKKLVTGAIVVENIKGQLGVENNDLIISDLNCNAFMGNIKGDVIMNLLTSLLTIKLNGEGLDANRALVDAANMKDTISGDLDFKTDISLKGSTYEEQVQSLKGNVDFELTDGQYGPFAKLENFFLAENIRENIVFRNTIGLILTPLTTIDSTHFDKLVGSVSFNNGVVGLNSIKSQGDILCILINGDMNLLTNIIDSKVRVRLASAVSDLLGPIAVANPINLVKKTPGLNVATAKLFSVFSQVVTQDEYNEIPDFAKNHSDSNATKFQIVLAGDVARPLTLVKSFKWLALQSDIDRAHEFSENYIQEQEELARQEQINKLQKEYEADHKIKVGVQKVLHIDTTAPAVKELLKKEN